MSQTFIEKIVQRHTFGLKPGQLVRSGDYISITPSYVMTHDNTGAVIPKFKNIGTSKFFNSRQIVFTLDHDIQNKEENNLAKYKMIEEFAKEMDADFYPDGRGIGHQIMCEEGYAWPGTLVVASDSHSNMYGGLGCLGTPIVRTDAAAIWATGRTWWQIPQIAKVELKGKLKKGVSGKDIIIALCGFFNNDEVLNHGVEFVGDGIEFLSIDQRLTISNMTTEWGALTGLFPIDYVTINWLNNRLENLEAHQTINSHSFSAKTFNRRITKENIEKLISEIDFFKADSNAFYSKELSIDLASIENYVSGPNSVKTISSVSEIKEKRIKIDKAYLVSCVNSRLSDIKEAADILRNKKIAEGVKLYISAASNEVQAVSESLGYWKDLINAGAIPLPPGCGPCIGLGEGLLEDGEVGISATNRNFKGRMGSKNAQTFLASPAVVAESALAGYISSAEDISSSGILGEIKINSKISNPKEPIKIINGFPTKIIGEIIFCFQDNLNTDAIYPGKYTYQDDITPEQQAKVVMENYDPNFLIKVSKGDLLVGGFNFGIGSSREQAATALKYSGLQLVIAGSFNETYKRNALNNGFLCIECPEIVNDLKKKYGAIELSIKTGMKAEINFVKSILLFNQKEYIINPIGIAAQELILTGGLEHWIKAQFSN